MSSGDWFPPTRPNSDADILPTHPKPSLDSHNSVAEPQADPVVENSAVGDSHYDSREDDSRFPDYEAGDGDDLKDDSTDNVHAPTEVAQHDDTPQSEVLHIANDIPQHSSRMSFARTVSHEVNFYDDDEVDYPTRTGTDLFGFMPPNDRTNSFPPVPPLKKEEDIQPEEPPSTDAIEEAVEESRPVQDHTSQETSDLNRGPIVDESSEPRENEYTTASYPLMGGESTNDVEGGSTEFTPLFPSDHDGVAEENSSKDENDLFGGGEVADGDDFFSQIPEDGNQQPVAEDASFTQIQEAQSDQVVEEDGFFTQEKRDGSEQVVEEEAMEADDFFTKVQGMESEQAAEDDDFFTKVQDDTADPLEQEVVTEETTRRDGGNSPETANEADIEDTHAAPEAGPEVTSESALKTTAEPAVEGEGDFWGEIAEEDEFLPDENPEADPIDATAFLPSDDEGFLPSDDEGFLEDSEETTAPVTPTAPAAPSARYLPASQPAQPVHSYFPTGAVAGQAPATGNMYAPAVAIPAIPTPTPFGVSSAAPPAPTSYGYGAPPPPVKPPTKAQSFADKSKGGYTSPYDLPMDVVKPKKRASMANLQKAVVPGVPLPRSASYNAPPPTSPASYANVPPHARFSQPPQSTSNVQKSGSAEVKPREKFFEDLPITTKPRPTSRQSNKSLPSPQTSSYPPPHAEPPPFTQQHSAPQVPHTPSQSVAEAPSLVTPPLVNPYASLPSNGPTLSPAMPAGTATRYSPAPPSGLQANGSIPPPVQSRYSPAPPATRQTGPGYAPPTVASAPPILPHQPRTSSPLAHFEISHDKARTNAPNHSDGSLADRRVSSSMYDPRLQRVPSLPPTREVEEEETQHLPQTATQYAPLPQQTSPPTSMHGQVPCRPRQTTPPSSHLGPSPLSPPNRATSGHVPTAMSHDFAPPPRSQTQSPGAALYGNRNGKVIEAVPRPSSVHDPAPPRSALHSAAGPPHVAKSAATSPVLSRSHGFSQNLNLVAPTDGRENDPLQRWRGAPLLSWGVGGTIITMFPTNIPRYGMHQTAPMVVRSPGEVRIKSAKDIQPLEDRLAKFPGPLKGKSKKKETIAWLNTGIESLEHTLPSALHAQHNASHEDKRAVERVLLWKILRLFVEHDGSLEGNPTIRKAVRDVLLPDAEKSASSPIYLKAGSTAGLNELPATASRSDAVDASAVEQIQLHLQHGDAEKAVWTAVDKRLWGHALILANALAPTLYQQVAQEFVKKEINLPGQKHEPLAALYTVLSGNHEDSVDELVPLIARSGRQLVAKNTAPGSSKDALDGLDKWRETLGLILSNRSTDDARAINALGSLLSDYGRAEAAHICFLFARSQTVFGGLDDPKSNFVLVGSDHKRQSEQFAKEIEPLLLSEVYEYGQSLAGAAAVPVSNPHLAAYKLQHALALAEFGFRDKALQYCEAIYAAITAQTKRSPYHHAILEAAVQDLMIRLKQAPKEESSSWIPKPSMNKVSDTMWNRFNKFVAGDENDASGQASPNEESGPFARIAGGTPTISRSPSANNLETFGATIPSYGMPNVPVNGPVVSLSSSAPSTKAASRYAPGVGNPHDSSSAYAPRSSMERSSGEYQRSSLDLPRQSSEFQQGYGGSYSPNKPSPPSYAPNHGQNTGLSREPSYGAMSPPQTSAPSFGYEPLGHSSTSVNGATPGPAPSLEAPTQTSAGGYQPSYGYAPSSQTSYEPHSQNSYEAPSQTSFEPPAADNNMSSQGPAVNSFEPPSYQPYGYEPPTYEPNYQPANDEESDEESKPKPKKKGIMYDDDEDDFGSKKPATDKSKEDKDRENAEMFRKAAEEDAKRAAEAKAGAKKGWGFTGWFGGGGAKKESQDTVAAAGNKPVRAKLGEANSFYYDPDQKRWVNKNAGPEETTAKKAAPPPPRSAPPMPRSASSSPAPPTSTPMFIPGADAGRASAPPPSGPPRPPMGMMTPPMSSTPENGNLMPGPPAMMRSVSNTSSAGGGPPSRPTTSLSNSSSIDDLLAAAGPRKAGAKKARKSARYVDVLTK